VASVPAPQLPLPIPVPLAKGSPGTGYPYSWSIYQWLDGEPASADRTADPVRFAVDLAGFLAALQSIDTTGAPPAGNAQLVPGRHTAHLR
jgi:aminoglycoside phosphotransferase (APT) family kinase protein